MLRQLRFEEDNSKAIEKYLGEGLQAASGLLATGLEILDSAKDAPPKSGTSLAKAVLISIGFDAIRRLRAALAACELGYADEAVILTRSLFESLLAFRYIVGWKRERKKQPSHKGGLSAWDSRARLYIHAPAIKALRVVDSARKTRGIKRTILKRTRDVIAGEAAAAEKEIGHEWYERIQETGSFAGMRIRTLASRCGLIHDYVMFYSHASHISHGGDALKRLKIEDSVVTLDLRPDFKELTNTLMYASSYATLLLFDTSTAFTLRADDRIRREFHAVKNAVDHIRRSLAASDANRKR